MAISGNAFSASDFAATIPEVWSNIINTENFPEAVLTNFCLDLSQFVEDGGDIVHVPDLYTNNLTSATQSTEGAEITPVSPAQVDDSITVTTHEYVAWLMGDNTMSQVARFYNLNEAYAREAQGVLMNVIEAALAALWSSLSTTAVGDTSNGLTDADIRRAISTLESANFRVSDMAIFVHPEVKFQYASLAGNSSTQTDEIAGNSLVDNLQPSPYWEGSETIISALVYEVKE